MAGGTIRAQMSATQRKMRRLMVKGSRPPGLGRMADCTVVVETPGDMVRLRNLFEARPMAGVAVG